MASSPPPHVAAALAGQRPDFVLPARAPQGPSARVRLLLGVVALAFGVVAAWIFAFGPGEATFTSSSGDSRPMGDAERLAVGAGVLLVGLLLGGFMVSTAVKALREEGAWLAGTPAGILVVTGSGTRLEPWSGFRDARIDGADVHLVARVGLRDPQGRMVPGEGDPARIRQLCLARIRGPA